MRQILSLVFLITLISPAWGASGKPLQELTGGEFPLASFKSLLESMDRKENQWEGHSNLVTASLENSKFPYLLDNQKPVKTLFWLKLNTIRSKGLDWQSTVVPLPVKKAYGRMTFSIVQDDHNARLHLDLQPRYVELRNNPQGSRGLIGAAIEKLSVTFPVKERGVKLILRYLPTLQRSLSWATQQLLKK